MRILKWISRSFIRKPPKMHYPTTDQHPINTSVKSIEKSIKLQEMSLDNFRSLKRNNNSVTLTMSDGFPELHFEIRQMSRHTLGTFQKILNGASELRDRYGLKIKQNISDSIIFLCQDFEKTCPDGGVDCFEFTCHIQETGDSFAYSLEWSAPSAQFSPKYIRSFTQVFAEYHKFISHIKNENCMSEVGKPLRTNELPPSFPGLDTRKKYKIFYKDQNRNTSSREISNVRIWREICGSHQELNSIEAFCHKQNEIRTFHVDRISSIFDGSEDLTPFLKSQIGRARPKL